MTLSCPRGVKAYTGAVSQTVRDSAQAQTRRRVRLTQSSGMGAVALGKPRDPEQPKERVQPRPGLMMGIKVN